MAKSLEIHGDIVSRKRTHVYFLGDAAFQCVDTVVLPKVPSTAYLPAAQCGRVIRFAMR
jgi:hypothetical protein